MGPRASDRPLLGLLRQRPSPYELSGNDDRVLRHIGFIDSYDVELVLIWGWDCTLAAVPGNTLMHVLSQSLTF